MDDRTPHTAPVIRTAVEQDIRSALRAARDLGPEYDDALVHSLTERLSSAPADQREKALDPADLRSRLRRTANVAALGAGAIAAAGWGAASAPAEGAWATLAVVLVIAHVVRTWRS